MAWQECKAKKIITATAGEFRATLLKLLPLLADRVRFRELAENELLSLQEGNYARHRVSSSEFDAWREVWDAMP